MNAGSLISQRRPRPATLSILRLAAVIAGALTAAGIALTADSLWIEPRRLQRRTVRVNLSGLPPALSGLTVLHLSDFHYTPRNRWLAGQLRQVAKETQANPPDLIAITGDFVEWDDDATACAALLAPLRSRLGCFAVLGNHDYGNAADPQDQPSHPYFHHLADVIGGPLTRWTARPAKPGGNCVGALVDALEAAGITVLRNAAEPVCVGNTRLWIAGVDEPHQRRACVMAALARVPTTEPLLLLAHSPEVLEQRYPRSPKLTLAGHTHGGQVRLPGMQPLVTHTRIELPAYRGLIETEHGPMYINAGMGASAPLRFRCPPEVVTLVLTSNE